MLVAASTDMLRLYHNTFLLTSGAIDSARLQADSSLQEAVLQLDSSPQSQWAALQSDYVSQSHEEEQDEQSMTSSWERLVTNRAYGEPSELPGCV